MLDCSSFGSAAASIRFLTCVTWQPDPNPGSSMIPQECWRIKSSKFTQHSMYGESKQPRQISCLTSEKDKEMRKIPPEVRVVEVEPLPAYHLDVLKELVKRAALRKLRQMQEAQRKAS